MISTDIAKWALVAALVGVLGGCASTVSSNLDAPEGGSPSSAATPAPESEQPADDGSSAAEPGAYVDYRDGIIAETVGTKVLFFHAEWCPKCRALEESIQSQAIPDGVTIIKVDYDTQTALRQQYGVTLQTTIVYVDDDGTELSKGVLYDSTTLDALLELAP